MKNGGSAKGVAISVFCTIITISITAILHFCFIQIFQSYVFFFFKFVSSKLLQTYDLLKILIFFFDSVILVSLKVETELTSSLSEMKVIESAHV